MVLSYFARVLVGLGVELYARLVRTGTKCHKVKTRTQRRAWCAVPSTFGLETPRTAAIREAEGDALDDAASHRRRYVKLLHRRRISLRVTKQ